MSACSGHALDGTVTIVGSSTLRPFISRLAGDFVERNPRSEISVDAPGTGQGMFLFCDGRVAIASASRSISAPERKLCHENGIRWVELAVALDAIVVAVDPALDVRCLTVSDLYALTGPESGGINVWAGAVALARQLGASTALPESPLRFVTPPGDSGTVSLYIDLVIAEAAEDRGRAVEVRPDSIQIESDLLVADRLHDTPSALGILGFSAWQRAPRDTHVVAVDAGRGCVKPTAETIAAGRYPLSRKLYLYVVTERATTEPTLRAFVDQATRPETLRTASAAGSIPLGARDAAKTRARWERARSM